MSILENACDELIYSRHCKKSIMKAYSEPHRAYHNVHHVEKILSVIPFALNRLSEEQQSAHNIRRLMEAAIWHDYIYPPIPLPPGRPEFESILAYIDWMGLESNDADNHVQNMILATAFHGVDQPQLNTEPLIGLFLDLDLSSFASKTAEEDSDNVRIELCAVYGEEKFLVGNRAFLRQMLKRKQIYYHMTDWEAPARDFISKRIDVVSQRLKRVYEIGEA